MCPLSLLKDARSSQKMHKMLRLSHALGSDIPTYSLEFLIMVLVFTFFHGSSLLAALSRFQPEKSQDFVVTNIISYHVDD